MNINYATGAIVHHGNGTHTKHAACPVCGYETNSDHTPDLGRHMRDHYCPGLGECMTHPRWHVVRYYCRAVAAFPSHAEAINYATQQAKDTR